MALFDETQYAFTGSAGETGPMRYDEPFYKEFLEAVQNLPACTAVGEVRDSVWAVDASPKYGVEDMERNLELRQVNDEYINYSPTPLQREVGSLCSPMKQVMRICRFPVLYLLI